MFFSSVISQIFVNDEPFDVKLIREDSKYFFDQNRHPLYIGLTCSKASMLNISGEALLLSSLWSDFGDDEKITVVNLPVNTNVREIKISITPNQLCYSDHIYGDELSILLKAAPNTEKLFISCGKIFNSDITTINGSFDFAMYNIPLPNLKYCEIITQDGTVPESFIGCLLASAPNLSIEAIKVSASTFLTSKAASKIS